jgi:ribulose-phosphate 3-epimerase
LDNNDLQNVEIEVDGGIKAENLSEVLEVGANMIVSGSGLFSGNFTENVQLFKEIIKEHIN